MFCLFLSGRFTNFLKLSVTVHKFGWQLSCHYFFVYHFGNYSYFTGLGFKAKCVTLYKYCINIKMNKLKETAFKVMSCLIVLILRITTAITGRNIKHLSLENNLAKFVNSRKVGVSLHQVG